jgi:LCP family protein required for cell wall assembly
VTVDFPASSLGTTYIIAGSDSRSALPAGNPNVFGSAAAVPGQRADVVIVIHEFKGRVSILSIPRDILVSPSPGTLVRLTLTLLMSPQSLVDGLCNTLGIAGEHLVIVNFASFADIVNVLGGVTVNVPHPVRDPMAALYIANGGVVHLNGFDALALVRSRNPQWLVNGHWVKVADGSQQRTEWAGKVLEAILASAHDIEWNPLALQDLAWTAAGSLTTDHGTGLADLIDLGRLHAPVVPLPAAPIAKTVAVLEDGATRAALRRAGYEGSCHV